MNLLNNFFEILPALKTWHKWTLKLALLPEKFFELTCSFRSLLHDSLAILGQNPLGKMSAFSIKFQIHTLSKSQKLLESRSRISDFFLQTFGNCLKPWPILLISILLKLTESYLELRYLRRNVFQFFYLILKIGNRCFPYFLCMNLNLNSVNSCNFCINFFVYFRATHYGKVTQPFSEKNLQSNFDSSIP